MSGFNEDRKRQVIPRWRSFGSSMQRGELSSHTIPNDPRFIIDQQAGALLADWKQSPGLSIASELVSVALTMDLKSAIDAAQYILDLPSAPHAARELALVYLRDLGVGRDDFVEDASGEHESVHTVGSQFLKRLYVEVHTTRVRLHAYPRNPMIWCNLSRLYTSLGQQHKADRAMDIALSMAKDNRFVLRSASRLLHHQGDRSKAHKLLADSPSIMSDPWILSAEIATAASIGRTSKNVKAAQRILSIGRYSPFHTSELSSAIGTMEMVAGKIKAGRKLIETSLVRPSENSVAQAAWIYRNVGPVVPPIASGLKSPEAAAWAAWRSSNWTEAMQELQNWQLDEPFSSRPAIFGSHVASVVLEDYRLAATFAKQSIVSNPDDATLYNNLAFALALNGEIAQATAVLQKADSLKLDRSNLIALPATKGLVAFRAGMPEVGRSLYELAIQTARAQRDSEREALARLYLAMEALRSNLLDAEALRGKALDSSGALMSPPYRVLIERLKKFKAGFPTQ